MKIPTKEIKIPKVVVYFLLFIIISGIITAIFTYYSNKSKPKIDLAGYKLVQLEEPRKDRTLRLLKPLPEL